MPMPTRPSQSWIAFCYASFATALAMMALGIALIGDDWWKRGFFAMAALLLVQSCFSLAKTLRDAHDAGHDAGHGAGHGAGQGAPLG